MNRHLVPSLAALLLAAGTAMAADPVPTGDEVVVTGSRIGQGTAGTSTSVITAEDIARSPALTLPDILGLEAGVQTRDLFGGVGGSRATVDIRGFGASAKSNTLVLVNGRKINDFDTSGIDWASIPKDSIQRIEVTRGNGSAVLYGDGAVGGVINIVTKSSVGAKPSGSVHVAYGSFSTRQVEASASSGNVDGFSLNAFGSYLNGDGYRENSEIIDRNLVSELRYAPADGSDWFVKIGAEDQSLGLPGVQRLRPGFAGCPPVTPTRRDADTPNDKALQNSLSATLGHSRSLSDGLSLIVDGGVRHKDQTGEFIDACGGGSSSYVETEMNTWSFTPRLTADWQPMGYASSATFGIDTYYVDYESSRRQTRGVEAVHIYNGSQISLAAYGNNELALTGSTRVATGFRVENARLTAGDTLNSTAPGAFGAADQSLTQSDTMYAVNLGLEQDVATGFTLFGRVGRSFRTANIDERIGATGTSLDLKPQWSFDTEVGGRATLGPVKLQSSVYRMRLHDEIHFVAATFTNVNLDPTERMGWENSAEWQALDTLRFKGAASYTRARFVAGRFDGNDVPLVAPWSGSVSAFWDFMKDMTLAATVHAVDDMRHDNDQANFQPKIGAWYTADLKLMGKIGPVDWSAQVNNLFDRQYYTYGIASAATAGVYNIYPLPERTYTLRAGVAF